MAQFPVSIEIGREKLKLIPNGQYSMQSNIKSREEKGINRCANYMVASETDIFPIRVTFKDIQNYIGRESMCPSLICDLGREKFFGKDLLLSNLTLTISGYLRFTLVLEQELLKIEEQGLSILSNIGLVVSCQLPDSRNPFSEKLL